MTAFGMRVGGCKYAEVGVLAAGVEVVFVAAVGAEPFLAAVEPTQFARASPRLSVGIKACVADYGSVTVDDCRDIALIVGEFIVRLARAVEISAAEARHDNAVAAADRAVAVIISRRDEPAPRRYLAGHHRCDSLIKGG